MFSCVYHKPLGRRTKYEVHSHQSYQIQAQSAELPESKTNQNVTITLKSSRGEFKY